MRIVSVNAWGGAMHDELLAWLRESNADIVCLQEVTRTPGATGWSTFADGERTLPQRLNLLDDLARCLPRHQPHFVVNDAGPVVDAGGARRRQDFGIATFVRDEHPVTGLDARFVHSSSVDHEEWSVDDRPRAALTVTVRDRAAGRTVAVIQAHGLRDPAGKQDTAARMDQARRLADAVRAASVASDLVVLCGDLNLLPHSETFTLLRAAGMTDLVGTADTRASRYRKPIRSASYLLVSDESAVRGFEIVASPEVSDHRALLLDI
ncbi:metal-dependent hydrolase [Tsukamurella sp. TY48]|uniref:endonuclease/exonuclease/phosphatase family protein n=1 Tax=Tsukamurella TaxID=2060 RepID=UPI001C7E0C91|nr:endonuclease/exonuclease/phosphatase family protein [Tsukamurella sp. TY48]GIZ97206.1 metal-dependent hydrolase [Tsukamurella sp. TY48]